MFLRSRLVLICSCDTVPKRKPLFFARPTCKEQGSGIRELGSDRGQGSFEFSRPSGAWMGHPRNLIPVRRRASAAEARARQRSR
jgi:hypothetical protein